MRAEHDAFFVAVPSEAAFLGMDPAVTGWVRPYHAESPKYCVNSIGVFSRARALELVDAVEWPWGKRRITMIPAPMCACCGKTGFRAELKLVDQGPPAQWRCDRHVGRDPCLVPGCGKSIESGKRPRLDRWICGDHWRLRTMRERLVFNRLRRLQRKSGGWTDQLARRYWRAFDCVAARIIQRARGDVDVDIAEIERLFGIDG